MHIICERDHVDTYRFYITLHWRHNEPDGVSNHQPRDCLLNCLFRCRSKKTSKLRVTGLCAENSPGTREFPAQMASNVETVSVWWRHHEMIPCFWHIMRLMKAFASPFSNQMKATCFVSYKKNNLISRHSCLLIQTVRLTHWPLGDAVAIINCWFSNS